MIYIIVGSGGGLGSYLYSYFESRSFQTIGLDISDSPFVDLLLDEDFSNLDLDLRKLLSSTSEPISFIYSIADPNRSRSFQNPIDLTYQLQAALVKPLSLFLSIASFLQHYSPKTSSLCHLVSIGSVLSDRFSRAETPLYGATKAAINSLVRDLSIYLMEYNVSVNSISPALLYRDQESQSNLQSQLSCTRLPFQPTSYLDIAKTIQFISKNCVKSLRGKNIILDHGLEDVESFDLLRHYIS